MVSCYFCFQRLVPIIKIGKDTDDLIKKCFEFDWSNNKIAKFIKNDADREKIKNILRSNYKIYKDCYRYYSSFQPLGKGYIYIR